MIEDRCTICLQNMKGCVNMKASELRIFVLNILQDGKEYSQDDIQKTVDEHFGKGIYTEIQIYNLVNNLIRTSEICRIGVKRYRITNCDSKLDNKDFYSVENYIKPIKEWCLKVKKDLDQPKFLSRFKENMDKVGEVYELNERILKLVDEYTRI